MKIAESLIQFIYGQRCLGCGKGGRTLDPWLCSDCAQELVEIGCRPVWPLTGDVLCLFPMEPLTHKLVLAMKYGGIRDLAAYLVKKSSAWGEGEAALALSAWSKNAFFVPVPIHDGRLRERGYNQCEGIARTLAEVYGCDCKLSVLWRQKYRESQTWLGSSGRGGNVAGSFAVRAAPDLKGKSVIVVDDVYTTGATTGACARVLEKADLGPVRTCTLMYEMPVAPVQDWVADLTLGSWNESKKAP